MLYAGLDLSRQRLDVHVLDEEGRTVEVTAVHPDRRHPPDVRGLRPAAQSRGERPRLSP